MTEADYPKPRDTLFMRRLGYLIAKHLIVTEREGLKPARAERIALRSHVASAKPQDVRDMVLRRFHEFGGSTEEDFMTAEREINDTVRRCREEHPAGT